MTETFGFEIAFRQACGHRVAILVEVGVDAGDDDIHLLEHGIGEVECAVDENVDFNPGEDAEAFASFSRRLECARCEVVRARRSGRWRRPDSWSGR